MKILYLHQYFNTPAMSGGTRSYEMARRFAAAGHDVHMITSARGGGSARGWRTEQIEGFTVHWYPVPYDNTMSFARRVAAFFSFAVAASRRAARLRGDIVFATSTPLTIAIPAVFAKRRLRVPLVFEVRDLWPDLPIAMGALRSPLTIKLARLLEAFAYRNSDRVVALSDGMAEGVSRQGYPRERIVVAPNSADIAAFKVNEASGSQFRHDRPWLGRRPVVLYAGTLGHINGVSYLVEVAKHSDPSPDGPAFLIIGDGAEREAVQAAARSAGLMDKTVFWEPPLAKSEMPAAYSAATVCTSLFLPITAMEANSANKFFDALAAGRPVAINYGGWMARLVRDHALGAVLPAHDPAEAARLLRELFRDDERLNAARSNSARLAEEFGRDSIVARVLESIEDAWRESTPRVSQ